MKIVYPNKIKDADKYSDTLVWRYSEPYPEFSAEQLRTPIVRIVNNISGPINRMETYEEVISQINLLKSFLELNYQSGDIQRASSNGLILSYSKGDENLLRRLMRDKFPEENKEKYLSFVSEISRYVINELCQEIENHIPYSAKIDYQRYSYESSITLNRISDSIQPTFVEQLEKENMLPRKKRGFANIIKENKDGDIESDLKESRVSLRGQNTKKIRSL